MKNSINTKIYEVIIFDLDGVIIDSRQDIIDTAKQVLGYFGCPQRDDEFISRCIGGGLRNLLIRCMGESKQDVLDEAVIRFTERYMKNCANNTGLYPGVKDVLGYFYKNKSMALATYKIKTATWYLLEKLGVIKYFDIIITADDVKNPKPHPECLQAVLTALNSKPEKAIMIGDTEIDILTGKNARIDTCGVVYGIGKKEDLVKSKPNFIIEDIKELMPIVN